MSGPAVLISKYGGKLGEGFSQKEIIDSFEHPGRRTDGTQSAASWICDTVDRKGCVILCSYCRVNFNPRKNHYRRMYIPDHSGRTDGYQTNGVCDACKQRTENCGGGTAYIEESTYSQICIDPVVARRNARASAKAWSMERLTQRR